MFHHIPKHQTPRPTRGAVLLEVVLALLLLVAAAAVISTSLNASITTLDRLKLGMHASDLAVSLLSEVEMAARPMETAGPEPFEPPFDLWTWELIVTPSTEESPYPLDTVEVIVRHQTDNVARRLTELLPHRDPQTKNEQEKNTTPPTPSGDSSPNADF